jgi:pyruvate,orthophosphate dikinase
MRAAPPARVSASPVIQLPASAGSISTLSSTGRERTSSQADRCRPDNERLCRVLPSVREQLEGTCHTLELLFGDTQDFEFTLQAGQLYLLQTRRAKRTPQAALRIAVDLVEEGLLTPEDALAKLAGIDLEAIVRTRFSPPLPPALGHARVAGVGVASGAVALDSEATERMATAGTKVVLVRRELATADIAGIAKAEGILTARGGRTSHAAVVARELGKVCLVACADLTIDLDQRSCVIGGRKVAEGDFLSLDGNDGSIYPGPLEVITERPERDLEAVTRWRRSIVGIC